MWLRRSAIVILLAGFPLASFAAGARDVKTRTGSDPIHVTAATNRLTLSTSPTRPHSVTIQSLWRSRPKSVLEETGPRDLEESDLGAVLTPIRSILFGYNSPTPCLRLATLQLRC
jgi:hypothetical protein